MKTRILRFEEGALTSAEAMPTTKPHSGWWWIDIIVESDDAAELAELTTFLQLDPLAVRDSVEDADLPKMDDFDHHLLLVLHGLRDDSDETYELDCFLSRHVLVTVHQSQSSSIDSVWGSLESNQSVAPDRVDMVLARVTDTVTRRLLSVVNAFDERIDDLVDLALAADGTLLGELTAVRSDLSTIKKVLHPQREALDLMRRNTSTLVSDQGRRMFADVFDVASRAVHGLDAARSALAETLDAYRGAEARQATDVSKVLTIYAAIMLPLTLVAGFFGMNFTNLPGINSPNGLWWVTGAMIAIGVISLGVFVALGWIRRPSGRKAGSVLGRGLIEAVRTPADVVGAVIQASTAPLRGDSGNSKRDSQSEELT